jgi:hypothetical protein
MTFGKPASKSNAALTVTRKPPSVITSTWPPK